MLPPGRDVGGTDTRSLPLTYPYIHDLVRSEHRAMHDEVHAHPNDVLVTDPIRIDALSIGDVVLLPVYGESRVMTPPFFNPAHNRLVVTLIVCTDVGIKKLLCARNMSFQYVCFIL